MDEKMYLKNQGIVREHFRRLGNCRERGSITLFDDVCWRGLVSKDSDLKDAELFFWIGEEIISIKIRRDYIIKSWFGGEYIYNVNVGRINGSAKKYLTIAKLIEYLVNF